MKFRCFIDWDEIQAALANRSSICHIPVLEGTARWLGDPDMDYRVWSLWNDVYIVYIERAGRSLGAVFDNTDSIRVDQETYWTLIWQLEVELISK